jgi:CRP-like cAMP-binding protein
MTDTRRGDHIHGTDRLLLLRRVPYLANLSEDVLLAIAAIAQPRTLDRGQMIFLEGDPCAGLFLVGEGEVKIFKLSSQGREQILAVLGPGGTFNEVAVLDGGPNPASAAATEPAVVWVIRRDDVKRLAEAYPALAWALIESMARRARQLVEMVEDLSLRSVKARLAKLLLAQAERSRDQSAIERSEMVTQTEMAARLGTVREMVGRALRELADEGLITLDRQRIVIDDLDGLSHVAEG